VINEGKPIVSAWISSDGHYAFVDFRTKEEADTGFCLKELQIHGNYLKVGRPKNSNSTVPEFARIEMAKMGLGNITLPSQPSMPLLPGMEQFVDQSNSVFQQMNVKLMVENFPEDHTENMIRKILGLFGTVKTLDMIKDTTTGMFKGSI